MLHCQSGNPDIVFRDRMTLFMQEVLGSLRALAMCFLTGRSPAKRAITILVSSRYLSLIQVHLLAVVFYSLFYSIQIISMNGSCKGKNAAYQGRLSGRSQQGYGQIHKYTPLVFVIESLNLINDLLFHRCLKHGEPPQKVLRFKF